ncbi:MAG: phosphoglucomutase/phosphomannomutase family protein [Candidatus Omnitrophota bacterium]
MSQITFGTDGWRAIVGKDFTLNNVAIVAQAFTDYLKQNTAVQRKKVAVGFDRRRLSKEAAQRISEVLAGNGIKVFLSQASLPTQAVSFIVKSRQLDGGVMVTASHNPPQFNGIKIKGSFGGSVEEDVTSVIERLLFAHTPVTISFQNAQKSGMIKSEDFIGPYLRFLQSYLDMKLLKKANISILADPMYGTADTLIARALKTSACRVATVHRRHDFSFGGTKPEPIAECVQDTARIIQKKGFDIALVTDGDADRIAALDAQGRFINPQQIIALLLLHFLRYRKIKGGVVKTISGTALLDKIAEKYKLALYETPIGFKHIARLMREKDILIGGEEGGGMGFKGYLPERDGILAGLLLVEMMVAQQASLADLLAAMEGEFGSYVYLRKDIHLSQRSKERLTVQLARMRDYNTFKGLKIVAKKDYDGVKLCLQDGSWILFRLSGTEPLLRIYAESSSILKTKELINAGKKVLTL